MTYLSMNVSDPELGVKQRHAKNRLAAKRARLARKKQRARHEGRR